MSTRSKAAIAALAGVVSLMVSALRRWSSAPDATGGWDRLPPGRERTVEGAHGARLSLYEAGAQDGPVFVLAHCWTGDRRVWAAVARRLVARGCRVVLYDHRGHGRSSLDVGPVTLPDLADDLAAVLRTLPAEHVVLAGHSMGGMTAQAFAARHPELFGSRVAALGLIATATDGLAPLAWLSRFSQWLIGSPLSDFGLRHPAAAAFWTRFTLGRHACRAHLDSVRATYLATPSAVRSSCLAAMHTMDYSQALSGVRVPVAIVVGERDTLTPPSRSRRMHALVPHARFDVLPGAGHMLPLEQPEHITAVLLDLAARAGLEPPSTLELAS